MSRADLLAESLDRQPFWIGRGLQHASARPRRRSSGASRARTSRPGRFPSPCNRSRSHPSWRSCSWGALPCKGWVLGRRRLHPPPSEGQRQAAESASGRLRARPRLCRPARSRHRDLEAANVLAVRPDRSRRLRKRASSSAWYSDRSCVRAAQRIDDSAVTAPYASGSRRGTPARRAQAVPRAPCHERRCARAWSPRTRRGLECLVS